MKKNTLGIPHKPALWRTLLSLRRLIKFAVGLIVVFVFLAIAWVWFEERQRESLLKTYQAPIFYLNMLDAIVGARNLKTLMNDDEKITCFLSQRTIGNLKIDVISALSDKQISAIRNISLPSPDSDGRYWYILFFSNEKVSRIYLVNDHDVNFDLTNTDSGCVNTSMNFVIERKNSQTSGRGLLIKFQKGR